MRRKRLEVYYSGGHGAGSQSPDRPPATRRHHCAGQTAVRAARPNYKLLTSTLKQSNTLNWRAQWRGRRVETGMTSAFCESFKIHIP